MCRFNDNLFTVRSHRAAFTLVEVGAALVLLSIILSSVMVLMNRYVDSVIDLQLRQEAFELARGNMEQLLAESKLSDMAEFGDSEQNPEIEWQTLVEPFYEPVTDQMWIRAVCSAGFNDTKGEYQNIEMEHWITNLNAQQVEQILAQQQIEAEYMDLLADGGASAIEETTLAYLEKEGLDPEAYKRFIEQQKRKKLEYISEKGFEGYEEYLEDLNRGENKFLEEQGMDFNRYNEFAADYVPKAGTEDPLLPEADDPFDSTPDTDDPFDEPPDLKEPETRPSNGYKFDWANIPRDLWPIITQLTGEEPPAQ
ncbi:MAG: type IV pilus modification PilV family protein [Anaerohalosphaeraceae bacterium]